MSIIDFAIALVMALIMFGIGTSMRVRDFKVILKEKKSFLVGITLQMIFLPTFAFFIVYFADLSPYLKVGLFIVSVCPGGITSNFISYLVNANIALSVTLTSVNSALILFTVPLLSNFSIDYFITQPINSEVSLGNTFFQMLIILILPALLGVVFKERAYQFSLKIKKLLKVINTLLLSIVFGIKFFAKESIGGSGITWEEIVELIPYCLILHIGALLISYFFSRWIKIKNVKATTIAIEVGLQNTTLALLVTGTLIGINEMTKPALVFAMFSFFTTILFAFIAMRRNSYNLKVW